MVIQESMGLMEKLRILADGAKYDVACTSSGVNRSGSFDGMGQQHCCWDLPQLFS